MYCAATRFAVGWGWGGTARQLSGLSQVVLCVMGVVLLSWVMLGVFLEQQSPGHVGGGRWYQAL